MLVLKSTKISERHYNKHRRGLVFPRCLCYLSMSPFKLDTANTSKNVCFCCLGRLMAVWPVQVALKQTFSEDENQLSK